MEKPKGQAAKQPNHKEEKKPQMSPSRNARSFGLVDSKDPESCSFGRLKLKSQSRGRATHVSFFFFFLSDHGSNKGPHQSSGRVPGVLSAQPVGI